MTLTPEVIAQLVSTIGPVGTVFLIMYLYGKKAAQAEDSDVKDISDRLQRMEARLIRVETILEERK